MRRFLTALVLASVLVTTFPATYAQRAADKSKKAAASVTTQRAVDSIAASQLRNYLTFIASDEMEGRDTPSRGLDTTAKLMAMNLAGWGFKPAGGPRAPRSGRAEPAVARSRHDREVHRDEPRRLGIQTCGRRRQFLSTH